MAPHTKQNGLTLDVEERCWCRRDNIGILLKSITNWVPWQGDASWSWGTYLCVSSCGRQRSGLLFLSSPTARPGKQFCLPTPIHCELNGWVLPIEVLVESFQEVISMRPDGKGIIYIPKPHLGLVGRGLQVFHEDVRHDSERGEPIAAPCTCSKKDPPNWKYVDRRHSSTRWQSSGIGMLVRSSSVSSCCSRWKMTRRASSTGILVNITSVSARKVWWSRCTKSTEFFTCEGHLPPSGERILANINESCAWIAARSKMIRMNCRIYSNDYGSYKTFLPSLLVVFVH